MSWVTKELGEIDIQAGDRVVFVHIPKTAGTTFNTILEPFLSGLPRCPEYRLPRLSSLEPDKLRQYQVFSGHFPYAIFSEILFPQGFIGLTFLREPIARTISNF